MALYIDETIVVPDGTYKECDMGQPCMLIRIVPTDGINTLYYSYDGTSDGGKVLPNDVDHIGGVEGNSWRKIWIKMAVGGTYFVQGTPSR